MLSLFKGDCEHCGRAYHYSLVNASFSDCSYAYCDACGRLAIISYSSAFLLSMPKISTPHQVIDAAWEPYLRPCSCGGHFRRGAAPRCMVCMAELSAEHATSHIERNFVSGGRSWHWQCNWVDSYCIDVEDPAYPGVVRQVTDPFLANKPRETPNQPEKTGFFGRIFKSRS